MSKAYVYLSEIYNLIKYSEINTGGNDLNSEIWQYWQFIISDLWHADIFTVNKYSKL